ncbi:MAG: hypothetical protein HZB33_08670 [Nitrospirae bacterium]|nr:hypothetical protein [Nitrospirota bacterium]
MLRTVVTFLAAYLLFLVLWIQIKDYYGRGITVTASKVAAGVMGMRYEEMTMEGEVVWATFSPLDRRSGVLLDIPVKTSSYTFNAPLTFAIMAALYHFINKRKRAFAEGVLILILVHLVYVVSLEAKELAEVMMDRGLQAKGNSGIFIMQFILGFTENMVIRFEPFLIGFYIYMKFRK